ncbi:MAG: cyclic nucleotide-binding/CBS domain-containing protein [Nitrososphaerales archaeon]
MVKTITVSKKARLTEALKVMVKHDIGSVVVAEDHKGIGILTERDIMKIVTLNPELLRKKVEDIMSKPLITVAEDTPVWDAFRIMLRHKIRRLPVEKDGKLIGIVSERDLFRWVMLVVYDQNTPDDIKEVVQKGYPR